MLRSGSLFLFRRSVIHCRSSSAKEFGRSSAMSANADRRLFSHSFAASVKKSVPPSGVSKPMQSTTSSKLSKVMDLDRISQDVVRAQYAVRGEIAQVADELREQLQRERAANLRSTLPFSELVSCNIGNPQELEQRPLTFIRQVLALTSYPQLLASPHATQLFPSDVLQRASSMLASMPGGSGAYSHSTGLDSVRRNVAAFLQRRDGFASDHNEILLTNGASPAIQNVLKTLIRGPRDAILVPLPQYPLYTASIALFGGQAAFYALDEERAWGLSVDGLQSAVAEARGKGHEVRALVVINPGNPTGQVLSEANMREVVQFCWRERLVLLADEVYQENVYANTTWQSFKKILRSMPDHEIAAEQELFSFHSVSKGFMGECGRRGGYVECTNIHPDVLKQLQKLASIMLCPNLDGQIVVDLMVRPPLPGEQSYERYVHERDEIISSLKRRAFAVAARLNRLQGVRCNNAEGAMYLFPRITLPPRAVAAAAAANKVPDLYYCLQLLRQTGLVVVPGSGFGQKAGTWHFRTTFLPPEEKINAVLDLLERFHQDFMQKHS